MGDRFYGEEDPNLNNLQQGVPRGKGIQEQSHHHHHYGKYLVGGCVALFVISLLIFSGLVISNFHHSNKHEHEIHHLSTQQQQLVQHDLSQLNAQGNIYSVLSSKAQNHLTLCYTNVYYTSKDFKNESLQEVDNYSDHIHDESDVDYSKKMRKTSDKYYYMLDARIMIEFNVDLGTLIENEELLHRLRALRKPFMSIQSDITSNYHHFSTIKLVEMGLDAQTRLLKRTHEPVILCSQNPYKHDTRPCYNKQQNSPLLSVKYTKVTTMSHLSASVHGSSLAMDASKDETQDLLNEKEQESTKTSNTILANNKNNETTTYDLLYSQFKSGNDIYHVKNFIEGIRIYNILLYKQATTTIERVDSVDEEELVFNEIVTLSIKPNKCN
jgi:hypothetical protein